MESGADFFKTKLMQKKTITTIYVMIGSKKRYVSSQSVRPDKLILPAYSEEVLDAHDFKSAAVAQDAVKLFVNHLGHKFHIGSETIDMAEKRARAAGMSDLIIAFLR